MNPKEYKQALEDYQTMKAAERKEIEDLQHWGIKGMKWGVRKYQNKDGSLTDEGRKHYGVGEPRSAAEIQKLKMKEEKQKAKLMIQRNKAEAKLQMKMDRAAAKNDAIRIKAEQYGQVQAEKEETKQKRLGIKPEMMAERTERRNSSFGKKLVMAGIATGAVLGAVYLLRGRNVSSPEVREKAAKGKEIMKNNKEVAKTLTKKVSEVAKDNANNGLKTALFTNADLAEVHKERYIGLAGKAFKGMLGMSHSDIIVTRIPKEADHVTT